MNNYKDLDNIVMEYYLYLRSNMNLNMIHIHKLYIIYVNKENWLKRYETIQNKLKQQNPFIHVCSQLFHAYCCKHVCAGETSSSHTSV